MHPTEQLLAAYMDHFYGYGTYRGDWWLVGMEEGGGRSLDEVTTRLQLWDRAGREELQDVAVFAQSPPDLSKWFTPRPPLQPTWRGVVRLILAAEGRPTDAETARVYQGTALGRHGGNNCILELLPLPSHTVGHWMYPDHFTLPDLRTRQTYVERVAPRRVAHLRQRIQEHRPKFVVFYSRSYQSWWEQVAGVAFGPEAAPGINLARQGDTVFVMTKHPTYRGIRTQYFVEAGQAIASVLSAC